MFGAKKANDFNLDPFSLVNGVGERRNMNVQTKFVAKIDNKA